MAQASKTVRQARDHLRRSSCPRRPRGLVEAFTRHDLAAELTGTSQVTGDSETEWWSKAGPVLAALIDSPKCPHASRIGCATGQEYDAVTDPQRVSVQDGAAVLHLLSRSSMNLLRLADCGRRPGPFFTRRDDDHTTPSIEEVLRRWLESTAPLLTSFRAPSTSELPA